MGVQIIGDKRNLRCVRVHSVSYKYSVSFYTPMGMQVVTQLLVHSVFLTHYMKFFNAFFIWHSRRLQKFTLVRPHAFFHCLMPPRVRFYFGLAFAPSCNRQPYYYSCPFRWKWLQRLSQSVLSDTTPSNFLSHELSFRRLPFYAGMHQDLRFRYFALARESP